MGTVNITPAKVEVSAAAVEKVNAERAALRTKHGVRIVTAPEEGDVLRYAAGGIYGFTYAPQTLECGLFIKGGYLCFEMHKLTDNSVYLLVTVTPEMKQKLEAATDLVEIEFFPEAYDRAQDLVALPYEKLSHLKPPNRDAGNKIKGFYQPS
ncbi:MAG: hypothetical protein FJW30_09775 [Acidobacteria bacterium]|nr:hypothetical protein [Acidobacteriota bacterium]